MIYPRSAGVPFLESFDTKEDSNAPETVVQYSFVSRPRHCEVPPRGSITQILRRRGSRPKTVLKSSSATTHGFSSIPSDDSYEELLQRHIHI